LNLHENSDQVSKTIFLVINSGASEHPQDREGFQFELKNARTEEPLIGLIGTSGKPFSRRMIKDVLTFHAAPRARTHYPEPQTRGVRISQQI
jgi:hypothetical protein